MKMQPDINDIINKYIQKKIKSDEYNHTQKRKGRIIIHSLSQIIDPQAEKQKASLQRINLKLKEQDIRNKSVNNWFTHKKSIQSRLFMQKNFQQKQKSKEINDLLTIQSHKKRLQQYSQMLKNRIKQNPESTKFPQQKQAKNHIHNKLDKNYKTIYTKPFRQQQNKTSPLKPSIKRSNISLFYKTKFRNKFLVKLNDNLIVLSEKQINRTKSTIQRPFYQTFY